MAISGQESEPFVFYAPPSVIFRVIPLAYVAVVLFAAFYIPWAAVLSKYPGWWWLVIVLLASIVWMLRLAFPPRSVQARLDVRRDSVSFIPSRRDQSFLGM